MLEVCALFVAGYRIINLNDTVDAVDTVSLELGGH